MRLEPDASPAPAFTRQSVPLKVKSPLSLSPSLAMTLILVFFHPSWRRHRRGDVDEDGQGDAGHRRRC